MNEAAVQMTRNRWIVAILGVLTPYLSRLPGVPGNGWDWLVSYLGDNLFAPVFFALFNAVCWAPVIAGSLVYKRPATIWFPAAGALLSSFWMHSTVDLAADAQAAIALVVIPFLTLPFAATGWIIGYFVERTRHP